MRIISLNVGSPKSISSNNGESFVSGIRKSPTKESVYLSIDGLAGDSSYEECHGQRSMALHLFCFNNYAFFNQKIDSRLPVPAFGENVTVEGYSELEANVGDVLSIGEAMVQVSQPTERCNTIGRSLGIPKMLKWIHEKMMTGFYLRVLEEGMVSSLSKIELISKGPGDLNIARLNNLLFNERNRVELEQVFESPILSAEWKDRAELIYSRSGL